MKYESSAGAVVYYYDLQTKKNLYLILHYATDHAFWDFPKGKIEEGENKRQAALRETKEETALDVTLNNDFEQSLSYFFKDKDSHMVSKDVTFFIGQATTKDVTLSHEHIYFKWLEFDEARKQLTFQNARQLLQMADRFIEALTHHQNHTKKSDHEEHV